MRGKVKPCLLPKYELGITPAHAGKSDFEKIYQEFEEDHPRTCGEKAFWCLYCLSVVGSPPHMRGKEVWL